jgi:hypothetical protein
MQRIHLFRAGQHTATNGQTITFSAADLAASAAAYKPQTHEAPIVVGHPQTDHPAYGWVAGLVAEGTDLYATPQQVNPVFAEQVKAGAYKKVSASFYPPDHPNNPAPGVYYLRHVGFLGAEPPAVKGLKPTEFADASTCLALVLDFAEDTPAPAEPPATPAATPDTPAPAPATASAPVTPPTGEPPAMTPAEIKALQDELAASKAQLASAQTAMQAQARAAKTAEHVAYAEGLVQQGRITATDTPLLVATLDHLEPATLPGQTAELVQFGEGTAAKPLAQALRAFLDALPPKVDFSEQASRQRAAGGTTDSVTYAEGTPPESIDLDKRIRAHAAAHKLSYAEAATAITMLRA